MSAQTHTNAHTNTLAHDIHNMHMKHICTHTHIHTQHNALKFSCSCSHQERSTDNEDPSFLDYLARHTPDKKVFLASLGVEGRVIENLSPPYLLFCCTRRFLTVSVIIQQILCSIQLCTWIHCGHGFNMCNRVEEREGVCCVCRTNKHTNMSGSLR